MNQSTGIELDVFANQHLLCGESPIWDETQQCLYWTDALGEVVYSKTLNQSDPVVLFRGLQVSAIALHTNGGLVLAGKDGFSCLENGRIRKLSNCVGNIPVNNLNEVIADPAGRIFGGQEAFTEEGDYSPGYLFRVDINGSIRIMDDGIHLSNGMGFCPDQKTFYLTDTVARTIYAYDYQSETGDLYNKRPLIQMDKEAGLPDGMTVDKYGCLWTAHWFGNRISCYSPDGKLMQTIHLPAAQISSLAFGGEEMKELFISTAAIQWKTELAPAQHDYDTYRGGSLFRIKGLGTGKTEFKASI